MAFLPGSALLRYIMGRPGAMAHPVEHFRRQFASTLAAQLFVRLHMALIFAGTLSAGMIVSKMALEAGLRSMPLRYLLSASAAYLVFFLLVRLWIGYALRAVDVLSEPEVEPPLSRPARHETVTDRGRRGQREAPWPVRFLCEFFGEALGELVGYLVLFLLIVGSLLIVAVYLVWQAPLILVEAAFEVWLASTLLARVHDFERRGWVPILARVTLVPFAYVVVTAMIVAWWLQHVCSAAATLPAALTCWLGAR
jgi:hypothetical protein